MDETLPEKATPVRELPRRKSKLLIADDCDSARALVEIALCDEEDFLLSFASDGSAAISACEKEMPDLAILDMQMPGHTGIEVCQWIKERTPDKFTPVILVTSQNDIEDRVNGLNCGADDYITKPFALPELKARVRAFLRIKELTDRLKETRALLDQKDKQLFAAQIAGAAAHELGQPLTAMLLNCELMGKITPESAIFQDTLHAIQEQCAQMRGTLAKLNRLDEFKTKSYVGDLEILDLGLSSSVK